ncbi:MAG: universal stress protein [Saprospiraceae bacterium]
MKNILVPIDYSDVSANALRYAYAISKVNETSIKLIHISRGVNDWKNPADNDLQGASAKKTEIKEWGEGIIGKEASFEVSYELGMAVDIIVEASSSHDLIIMGSTGKHGVMDKWMGSVSSLVAKNADCPVLLTPPSATEYKPLDKVVVAFKEGIEDDIKLSNMPKIAGEKGFTEIHLVNVISEKEGTKAFTTDIIDKINNDMGQNTQITAEHIQGTAVIETVNEYATEKKMDLIVIVSERKNLLERLLHKSQTSALIMDIRKPVLVLHH